MFLLAFSLMSCLVLMMLLSFFGGRTYIYNNRIPAIRKVVGEIYKYTPENGMVGGGSIYNLYR